MKYAVQSLIVVVLAAANAHAHPALVSHVHPHGATTILGLDTLAGVAIAAVLAGAAWVLMRDEH